MARSIAALCAATVLLAIGCQVHAFDPIQLNGANNTGSVAFQGNNWVGYFSSSEAGQVMLNAYITGDNTDKVFVGQGYVPTSQSYDWIGSAIGTGMYEFWYPVLLESIFPNTTYYVAIECNEILSADFTLEAIFNPMPAPQVTELRVGDEPYPGIVDRAQYTFYTAVPSAEGNLTFTLQLIGSGAAELLVSPFSYATRGNAEWSIMANTTGKFSVTAEYVRPGQTVYASVWGRAHGNDGNDEDDLATDKYFISVVSP